MKAPSVQATNALVTAAQARIKELTPLAQHLRRKAPSSDGILDTHQGNERIRYFRGAWQRLAHGATARRAGEAMPPLCGASSLRTRTSKKSHVLPPSLSHRAGAKLMELITDPAETSHGMDKYKDKDAAKALFDEMLRLRCVCVGFHQSPALTPHSRALSAPSPRARSPARTARPPAPRAGLVRAQGLTAPPYPRSPPISPPPSPAGSWRAPCAWRRRTGRP
jgi:hypothetical protein